MSEEPLQTLKFIKVVLAFLGSWVLGFLGSCVFAFLG